MDKSGMSEMEEDTIRGDETEVMKVQEHREKNKRKTVEDKGRKASTRDVVKLMKWVVILAVVVILIGAGYKLAKQLGWFGLKPKVKTTILTSSQLEEVLQIDDLAVSTMTYNGVAAVPQKKHPNKIAYYVSYNACAKASMNMEEIKVNIDEDIPEGQVKMARENAEDTVKALINPIIENQDEPYELVIE